MKIFILFILLFVSLSFPATKGANFEYLVSNREVPGLTCVKKFGRAPSGMQTTATDVWDRADASTTQQIWLAPTAARQHWIVSDTAADSIGNTGAGKLVIIGLLDWDTDEFTDTVNMAGTDTVTTDSSYVIIHRMYALDWGNSGPNVGNITATAATDSTVTAQINSGKGQTQMAVYGIPSNKIGFIANYYVSIRRATATAFVDFDLFVNTIPDSVTTGFLSKHSNTAVSTGSSYIDHKFTPYVKIDGPAIVKIQGNASANDIGASAGFDIILQDK